MISIIILLILAWSFYIGYSRGIVLQGYYVVATIISMLIASQFYKSLANQFSLWVPYASATKGSSTYFFPSSQLFHLDKVFYAGLGYLFVFILAYVGARFIGIFINLIPYPNTWDTKWHNIVSGALAVFIALFAFEMCFTILATVPMAAIQERLNASFMIRFIINHTPITSNIIKELWVTQIIG